MPKQNDLTDQVTFGSFDAAAELEVTERNLPHWYQPGVAIFVTFRTADSLPEVVLLRWQSELENWLAARQLPTQLAESIVGQRLSNHAVLLNQLGSLDRRDLQRLCDRMLHRSLDECQGACLLKRADLAKIVGDAILFYQKSKYDLDRFVVMPNHVHAIVQFRTGASLKTVSQSWMRYSAREINASCGRSGAFWQSEPFDHIIRSAEQFEYLQRYIADNPAKANLRDGEFLYVKV